MVSELIVTACGCTLSRSLSHVWLFATPWTMAHQAPLSMGFARQEYWSGVPLPPGIGFLFSTLNQLSSALSASLLVFMACSTFAELLHWPDLWGRMSNGSRPRKECHRLLMFIPRFSRFSWWNTSHFIVCLWSISSQLRWLYLTVPPHPLQLYVWFCRILARVLTPSSWKHPLLPFGVFFEMFILCGFSYKDIQNIAQKGYDFKVHLNFIF